VARRQSRGHDLSLAVMQALALRSAVDSGLEVPPEAVGLAPESAKSPSFPRKPSSAGEASKPSRRVDYVKALLRKQDDNLMERLGDEFRLRAFLFDRPDGVRAIDPAAGGGDGRLDRTHLAEHLTTEGEVTALGAALGDLARRHATSNLAGVVIFSDFNQNSGPPALEEAGRLGVKIHTVGVGPVAAVDLAVDLQVPPVMKKDERSSLVATLRQDGFAGQTVEVKFHARPVSGSSAAAEGVLLAERPVTLNHPTETFELPYVPEQTGRWVFTAEVEPLAGEVVEENNRASRETTVRDDFIRLLFVEYEPTWEWRFIKEVFHRDKLVGMRGFRTFLRSADPKVRKTNELFLTTLSPARSEFFAHDVIVLGDMPASALSPRFCRMTEEFVGDFGGGLVVMAGPRFGPGQLAQTLLGDLLPVKVDPNGRVRHREPFRLRRTGEREGVGQSRAALLVSAGGATPPVGHGPGRAPDRRVRRREDAPAAGGRGELRPGRGRVSRVQRDVAPAAPVWRAILPPALGAIDPSVGVAARPGHAEAVRGADRSPPLPGRRSGAPDGRGVRRRVAPRATHRRKRAPG